MKKKISALAALIMTAVFMSGCGESSAPAGTSESTSGTSGFTVISPERSVTDGGDGSDGTDLSENESEAIYTEKIVLGETASETESEFTENSDSNQPEVTSVDSAAVSQVMLPDETFTDAPAEEKPVEKTVTVTIYTRAADVSRRAKEIVSEMTDEEKAAQLILARCPHTDAAGMMEDYSFGGYTLYASDFEERTPESAAEYIKEISESAMTTPFIAVDEEGGDVIRVSKYSQYRSYPFLSPGEIFSESGIDGLYSDASEKADLLLSLGINMNLAPVADVASEGDYIYSRIISTDYETAGEGAAAIINASGEKGLMSCLKHFPGYGSNVDTHTGISNDTRTIDEFLDNDFIPFKKALEADYVPAIMVNHNIIECMDDDLPASISPEVHKILRSELDFDGVIITDDLGMDGIKAYSGSISPYVMGIFAGNDLLCVSDPVTAYNDIIYAIEVGNISQKILDRHVERIIQMKLDYGIIE